jgi:hypothetical protein
MADQNKLLAVMVELKGEARSLDAICQAFSPGSPFGPRSKLRKQIINATGELMKKKLVERFTPARASFGGDKGGVMFRVTADGIARWERGERIGAPRTGPRKTLPKPKASMRQRLWEALRIAKKATVAELVELVHQSGDSDPVKVTKDGLAYFALLERAGIVTRLAVRASGFAPTSNGRLRWALRLDLGPIAPSAGKRCVTDHNAAHASPAREARISYREGEQ